MISFDTNLLLYSLNPPIVFDARLALMHGRRWPCS